jgi:hypothetical protein
MTAVLASAGSGQRKPPRPGGNDHMPLGGLGCEGDIEIDSKAGRVFRIATIETDGPAARGGLEIGDGLVALNGKSLRKKGDAVLILEKQIELSESRADGRLDATFYRDGEKRSATLRVDTLGAHERTCPAKCAKCADIRRRAVEFLVQTQTKAGSWKTALGGNNGQVVVTVLSGLALLGAGGHQGAVDRAIDYVIKTLGAPSPFDRLRKQRGGANWNQENWPYSYAPLLLATKRQDPDVARKLGEIAKKLVANQEGSGGYAHGPGGPNALGYLELEIVSNYALASLGLIRDHGLPVDEAGVDRGLGYIRACQSGDGGVAYSTREGQAGHGDPGRTAGAYFALLRNGLGRSKAARKMLKFFERGMDRLPSGHVSPMMHILAGAMAVRASGKKKLVKAFWKTYRPYIMASRLHSGAFAARPTKESQLIHSNTDRTLGHAWTTATLLIVMNIARDEKAYPHLFGPAVKRPKP